MGKIIKKTVYVIQSEAEKSLQAGANGERVICRLPLKVEWAKMNGGWNFELFLTPEELAKGVCAMGGHAYDAFKDKLNELKAEFVAQDIHPDKDDFIEVELV